MLSTQKNHTSFVPLPYLSQFSLWRHGIAAWATEAVVLTHAAGFLSLSAVGSRRPHCMRTHARTHTRVGLTHPPQRHTQRAPHPDDPDGQHISPAAPRGGLGFLERLPSLLDLFVEAADLLVEAADAPQHGGLLLARHPRRPEPPHQALHGVALALPHSDSLAQPRRGRGFVLGGGLVLVAMVGVSPVVEVVGGLPLSPVVPHLYFAPAPVEGDRGGERGGVPVPVSGSVSAESSSSSSSSLAVPPAQDVAGHGQ
mmetsp:Transcript_22491/g.43786  ORF Transcript_22491/g.43786 Transcript_22491/m.43786 type:complete len:255 (+) Transcript_22491:147-911(+)